jgi:hypothetical protein
MRKPRKLFLGVMAACLIPIGFAATALSSQASVTNSAALGTVYQAHEPCCQNIPVGQWPASSAPVLTTKAIPAGTYTVTANVFLVMEASDNENCWLTSANPSDVINGTGGSAGNLATVGGAYANAILTYTVVVNARHDTLTLNCDSKGPSPITSYVAEASLIATKVPAVVGI